MEPDDGNRLSNELAWQGVCKTCGYEGEQVVVLTPEHQHHAKALCARCRRWIAWVSKPDADKYRRPSADKKLVKKFSRGFCEMCLIREENIPNGASLEGHHIVEFKDGGEPTRENTWILCTACHRLVNWRRTYVGHMVQTLADKLREWKQ